MSPIYSTKKKHFINCRHILKSYKLLVRVLFTLHVIFRYQQWCISFRKVLHCYSEFFMQIKMIHVCTYSWLKQVFVIFCWERSVETRVEYSRASRQSLAYLPLQWYIHLFGWSGRNNASFSRVFNQCQLMLHSYILNVSVIVFAKCSLDFNQWYWAAPLIVDAQCFSP